MKHVSDHTNLNAEKSAGQQQKSDRIHIPRPSTRLKVLFITKWFMNRHDPQIGVFIRKHASAVSLYCDVALLCVLSDPQQKKLIETEEKVQYNVNTFVVYFRKFSSPFSFINAAVNFYRYLLANSTGLKKIRSRFGKHDVSHAYIMLRPALVAWWLKVFRGIPFVISEQWSGYATGKFVRKNALSKALYRSMFARADEATAVSEFLRKKMEAAGLKNKFTITPNVVEKFEKKISPLHASAKTKILSVADLVDEVKNISGVIHAIGSIHRQYGSIEYHIVGHGRDEQKLISLAQSLGLLNTVIFFHGVKTNEEVFQFLYAADFLVVNSWFETFSLICIEAMSCGKPVIATRCGGPEEFITPANGILVDPGNAQQLEQAIKTMLENFRSYDPQLLKDYAAQHYGAAETGKKFREIYSRILNR